MHYARKNLFNGSIQRGAFKIVLREEGCSNTNVVLSRFLLAIKNKHDGSMKYKARFVIGRNRDRDKPKLVHDSATVRPESVRMLLALAKILDFRKSVADWTQE